ncbi:hypothetical protein HanRHA438_Chr14g0671871 [Helianthus annuus]|nr:hypothetical protein HanRHA438_Chr14g0671871 [Helianthus annuus]
MKQQEGKQNSKRILGKAIFWVAETTPDASNKTGIFQVHKIVCTVHNIFF